jgi:hypothetical protein
VYPKTSLSIGLLTPYSTNDLHKIIEGLLEKYRAEGYSFNNYKVDRYSGFGYIINFRGDLSKKFSITSELTASFGSVNQLRTLALIGNYKFNFSSITIFTGAGISVSTLKAGGQNVDFYTRITPIDPQGNFNTLDKISFEGDDVSLGFPVIAGIELRISNTYLNLFGKYHFLSPYSINYNRQDTYKVNFSSFVFGLTTTVLVDIF